MSFVNLAPISKGVEAGLQSYMLNFLRIFSSYLV
jgi:hypothetical protein